jgi:ABC-2 type transport system ATP-binding protein
MIKTENLTKNYGAVPAISQVSFEVRQGEILGFLGPNGAGKTTTIRILTGFLLPTHGNASIGGFDIFENSIEARRIIGYVPETPSLYPEMTVAGYLLFHAKIKGVPRRLRRSRIDEILQVFKIEDVRNKLIAKLSKGYRQRVGLAQALVHDPKVIFFDEPTVGLDPRQIIDTREIIKSLAGKHTILLSTHILPEVSMVCNRVVIINEGKVIAEDTTEHLTTRLKGSNTILLEVEGTAAGFEEELKTIAGVQLVHRIEGDSGAIENYRLECSLDNEIRPELARFVVQKGLGLLSLRQVTLSLEEIYLKLTTEEEGLN